MSRISLSEFARQMGVSAPAITKAIKENRLSYHVDDNGKKFLLEDEARLEWERNTFHGARTNGKNVTEEEIKQKLNEDGSVTPTLNDSRAVREAYRARIEKIRYEELSNKVVDVEKSQKEYYEIARKVRDSMTAIPDRISAQIAAETNQFKVHKKLLDEIRIALRSLIVEEEASLLDEDIQAK